MSLNWIRGDANSPINPTALRGGHDSDGDPIYVGRAHHNGNVIPAKVIPNKKAAYVAYFGKEVKLDSYEVLTTAHGFDWEVCSHGHIPHDAVVGGKEGDATLYVGRTSFKGSVLIGKVLHGHKCLYFPYGGKEEQSEHYEVLVKRG